MKVVAFNGSPRKDGNTTILINHAFRELENEGIQTELVQLSGKEIHGCIACYKCFENKDQHCAVKNDIVNECIEKMIEADGMILGSPTYFTDVTAEMKALIDRAGFVSQYVVRVRSIQSIPSLISFLRTRSSSPAGFLSSAGKKEMC
jgi:multimeric flavodoxin WrbA